MLRHICCRMSKPFTVVIVLAHLCSLARGVTLVTENRDGSSATSTSVNSAESTDCDKVFLLIATGAGPFTYEFTSGNTNSAFSTAEATDSGDDKITCNTILLNSNSLTSYTLVVTVTDTDDSSTTVTTLTVTVTLSSHGADCDSNTGSCVSNATCATTCSCDSGYLDDSGLCKADIDITCSADADCDTSTNTGAVCDTNASPYAACKLGVGAACSVNNKCVTNGACEVNECSCGSGFTAQSNLCTAQPSSDSTTLTCYNCSGTNCYTDDPTGTQTSTSGSDDCVYCYIIWTQKDEVRGCLSSTTAALFNITKSGCFDWPEGFSAYACNTTRCNETPTVDGDCNTATQLNDFMTHLRLTFVTLCVFFIGI